MFHIAHELVERLLFALPQRFGHHSATSSGLSDEQTYGKKLSRVKRVRVDHAQVSRHRRRAARKGAEEGDAQAEQIVFDACNAASGTLLPEPLKTSGLTSRSTISAARGTH